MNLQQPLQRQDSNRKSSADIASQKGWPGTSHNEVDCRTKKVVEMQARTRMVSANECRRRAEQSRRDRAGLPSRSKSRSRSRSANNRQSASRRGQNCHHLARNQRLLQQHLVGLLEPQQEEHHYGLEMTRNTPQKKHTPPLHKLWNYRKHNNGGMQWTESSHSCKSMEYMNG